MDTPDDTDRDYPSDSQLQFGEWLRRCREQLGLTRKQFAELAGMSSLGLRGVELLRWLPTADERRRLVAAVAAVSPELAATAPEEEP